MRLTIAIAVLSAAALSGCGAGGAAADSSQVSQYVASGSASSASPSSGDEADPPKCLSAADVKSAMGIDVQDLTNGMQKFGTFWNCGYVPTDPALPGVSVEFTVASAAEADSRFGDLAAGLKLARGPGAQPDALQLGERAMAFGTPSGAVAAAVSGDRVYIVETRYGTAGPAFTDKKDGTIALLRKMIP
jgi:hypothetical protein